MNKEHVQWVVVGILIIAIAAIGTLVKIQGGQLQSIDQSLRILSLKLESAADSTAGKLLLPESAITAQNRFIFGTHKVGDVIAGLKITSIEPIPGIQTSFGSENYRVVFSGQKTFDASYSYEDGAFAGATATISPMNPDDLPMEAGEIGDVSYQVRNLDIFRKLISKEYGDGEARVVMTNFELNSAPAEVMPQADLVQVISKSKY